MIRSKNHVVVECPSLSQPFSPADNNRRIIIANSSIIINKIPIKSSRMKVTVKRASKSEVNEQQQHHQVQVRKKKKYNNQLKVKTNLKPFPRHNGFINNTHMYVYVYLYIIAPERMVYIIKNPVN